MPQMIEAITGATLFALNKFVHKESFAPVARTDLVMNQIENLSFYTAMDENGVMRGGNLPWCYMQDIILAKTATNKQKTESLRATLAKLPSNVSFTFVANPRMDNMDIVIDAFKKAGFSHSTRKTYTFETDTDQDLIKKLKPDARTKVNAGLRDMELVPMTVDEFFAYYKQNIDAANKEYYFNYSVDIALFKKSMSLTNAKVHILAARQKSSDKIPQNAPIDAAFFCGAGDDGFLKLMRITYRLPQEGEAVAPHKHAIKFLVFEAMRMAAINGLILDTDGFTPGGDTLYTRFGVFKTEVRHEFTRKTAQCLLAKFRKKPQAYDKSPFFLKTYSSRFNAFWRKAESGVLYGPCMDTSVNVATSMAVTLV